MFQVTRLPQPIVLDTDAVEIPQSLWPLIELYVLAKVRELEQNHETANSMLGSFMKLVEQLANKAQLSKPRQGLQVKVGYGGPLIYFGHSYVQ